MLNTPWYIEKRDGSNHIDLNGNWDFTYIPEATEDISVLEFPYSATLPAASYYNVYEAGLLPHFYVGTNSRLYRDLDKMVWYYRRSFTLETAPDKATHNAFLCFDGAGYYTRLFINGQFIGESAGMAGGPVCDAAPYLKEGKNEIILEVKSCGYDSPDDLRLYRKWGGVKEIMPWNLRHDFITSNGDFCLFGIWRDVRLEIMPKTHIARPYLYTKSAQGDTAEMGLELSIATDKIDELRCRLSGSAYPLNFSYEYGLTGVLSDDTVSIRVRFSDEDGNTVFDDSEDFTLYDYDESHIFASGDPKENMQECQIYERDILLNGIKLWYPQGLGDQPLYRVEITLMAGDVLLDKISLSTGIRVIEYKRTAGRRYRQRWDKYLMSVNGKSFFIKGMNWTPIDFLLTSTDEEYLWALDLLKNQGIQLVRVWNGGNFPEDERFYDYCDKNGILVWQDSFISNDPSILWDDMLLEAQICYNLFRLRNRASLAVNCGGNEFSCYHHHFNEGAFVSERSFTDLDPTRKYIRTTPDKGLSHNYNDMEPNWFRKNWKELPMMSEVGTHSFPNYKSLKQLVSIKEATELFGDFNSPDFANRFPELLNHFTENDPCRIPRMLSRSTHISDFANSNLESMCEATGIASYEFYQLLCQSMRENYPVTAGVMPWVFKRPWTTVAIQMVDGLGDPIAPYYAVKQAYAPLSCLVALNELTFAPGERINLPLKVINETRETVVAEAIISVYSPLLKKVFEKRSSLNMTSDEYITTVCNTDFIIPEDYSDKVFFIRAAIYKGGEAVNTTYYRPKVLSEFKDDATRTEYRKDIRPNMSFKNGPFVKDQVLSAKKTTLAVEVLEKTEEQDRITLKIRLENGDTPTLPVKLDIPESGTLSFTSDNYFFMDSGEERIISMTVRLLKKDITPTLKISSWNAETTEIML